MSNQAMIFKIDLGDLVPPGDYSSLFTIDGLTVSAYKQSGYEKVPVKFTALSENKRRILTDDPYRLSSAWQVDIECASKVKIAGTDSHPFKRTLCLYDEDNRQAFVNLLNFMMSDSMLHIDEARDALDTLLKSKVEDFKFTCALCKDVASASVRHGPSDLQTFSVSQCLDGYMCFPRTEQVKNKEATALKDLLNLLRYICLDDLDVIHQVTQEMEIGLDFRQLDCSSFPPRDVSGNIVIPYNLMKFVTSLYEFLSDQVDNFAILDKSMSSVRLLVESPADNIGLITGVLSLTLIHGASISDIRRKINASLFIDKCEDRLMTEEDERDDLTDVARLGGEVLLRRIPMYFKSECDFDMPLQDWYNYFYSGSR
ncbi:hypothetical protein WMY93_011358 [Mugilogobius chulae]|uniref:Uncharacterized protein n=1 Tax=Mugilogobius chulae TaxID=88201 RepID=A0AAW0P1X6_9GOBI